MGKSLADSCSQMALTGLKNRGAQTRKNSVSKVTAPTVPAAQARTIARARAGGSAAGGDARRSSRAEGSGPDSTKRPARLLAPGPAPSRAPAAPAAASSVPGPAAPNWPRTAGGEGTCARWPGLASRSPRLGGGVRAARAGRFEKRARDKGSRKPPRRPEPVLAAPGAPQPARRPGAAAAAAGGGSSRRQRMRQGAWERQRSGRSGAARARRG